MTFRAAIDPLSDWELVLTRIIDAPREKIFKAWTDPERLKQWFVRCMGQVLCFAPDEVSERA